MRRPSVGRHQYATRGNPLQQATAVAPAACAILGNVKELAGLRVVELSGTAAAAFAGRLCADAGAEVVLVEPPEGHPLRHEGPFRRDSKDLETSAMHLHVNAGKRSVVIELAGGADMLRK